MIYPKHYKKFEKKNFKKKYLRNLKVIKKNYGFILNQ
jgi:hypothetical protein